MPPEIIICQQGTEEWHRARSGIPTASEFANVMREKGKGEGGSSVMRRNYLLRIAGEVYTGEPTPEGYTNAHMERGKEMEARARALYEFRRGVTAELVGFVRNGRAGCSPDSLIGADGVLEIKTALPHIIIAHILKGDFPAEHKAQCQGALWVTERDWIDLIIYWPRMPLVIRRATREPAYIAKLADAIEAFNAEVDEVVASVRSYTGDSHADLKQALESSLL